MGTVAMAKIRQGLVCIVCNRPVVVLRGTMCQNCDEAFDRFNRRDSTTLGLIRWAAMRARKFCAGKVTKK